MPSVSSAQGHPQTREGFFISFGFGPGSIGCDACGGDRESGLSGYLKLGGTLNEQLLLGFESNAWVKEESGVTLTSAIAAAVVQYYPNVETGLFIKGGPGLARLELETSFGSASESGFGLIVGGGYDIRLGVNFSLSPYANFIYANIDNEGLDLWEIGLGFMWH